MAKTAVPMRPRFSLHRTRVVKCCDVCHGEIPVREKPDYAEYWKIKGGEHRGLRVICCLCHALYDFPTDGWEASPDGVNVMAASTPEVLA